MKPWQTKRFPKVTGHGLADSSEMVTKLSKMKRLANRLLRRVTKISIFKNERNSDEGGRIR